MKSPAWEGDWPISQFFGINPAGYARFGLAGHNGLDVAMPEGTRLFLPHSAQLWESGNDPNGYGFYFKFRADDGQNYLFGHLSEKEELPAGVALDAGIFIGLSGSTGNSTGPHLHFGYRLLDAPFYRGWPFNGYVDPRQVLDRLQGGLWPPT